MSERNQKSSLKTPASTLEPLLCPGGTVEVWSLKLAWCLAFAVWILIFLDPARAADLVSATVKVDVSKVEQRVDPYFMGMGLHPGERSSIQLAGNVEKVRDVLGLKSIRFPNGCEADGYNWIHPEKKGHITVDEFLDFCDRTGCRPYYTINMQGGTEALEGPVPPAASLDEKIRYKHAAPNPCGYPPTRYYYGTLAETVQLVEKYTVQRILDGRTPILDYEMGNENWGQATSDWPPEIYLRTIEVYAQAMRNVLERARAHHSELRSVKLRIAAVGYPMTGNNQNPQEATHHGINAAWTQGLNQLHERGLIDAVEEHFYAHSVGTGDALIWSEHNLNNMLLAREGKPNPRLRSYVDPQLAYAMPMDVTEWNLKCWGPTARPIEFPNGGFEDGLSGWTTRTSPVGTANIETVDEAARRGRSGLQIRTDSKSAWAEVRRTIPSGGRAELFVLVWVRTDVPARVSLIMRNAGLTIMERAATAQDRWQRYTVGGTLTNAAAPVEIVLRVSGPKVRAWFDDVEALYYSGTVSRAPVSVNTFEQQLFCVDAIRQMLSHGVQRTFLHHIFGNYGCTVVDAAGNLKENAKPFSFFAGRLGQTVLRTETQTAKFDYDGYGDKWATDFNAIAPDTKQVPCLSALAMRDGEQVHLLLLNRATDRTVKTKVQLNATPISTAEIRTLSGEDYNAVGAVLSQTTGRVGKSFTREVRPHSAELLSFKVHRPSHP